MTMTIPTIPALPAGHLATVAEMNQLAAACTFLLTKPLARIRDAAGGQAIGTSAVVVTMATTDLDLDGMAGVNANGLTVATPGWYKLRYTVNVTSASAQVIETFAKSTTGSNNPLGTGVVSAAYWGGVLQNISAGGGAAGGGSGLWPFYLYAGDFIQVFAQASAVGAVTTSTGNEGSSFSLELVSI